ncbi:MAG TPA: DUF4912 domain-containing protein [Pyrinomonadaceae bacterium]
MKKKKKDSGFIEFVLMDDAVSSGATAEAAPVDASPEEPLSTLAPSTKLEEMPPVFRELALPKLPELRKEDRARLQMQSPNRLFFYWAVGSNPFQKLNKALGAQTASYTLVLKLIDLRRDLERIYPADTAGSWWFDVEADGEYRAEVGFYAPNRPYIRALFSNTVTTPRKNPSPRVDSEIDWAIPAEPFARVLEVAGFTEDAFEVALSGDDNETADSTTHAAFTELIGEPGIAFDEIAPDEVRHAMLLLASGLALDSLRWRISPALFAILQERANVLSAEKALAVLKERFEIEADELTEEDLGPAIFGTSLINFPKRIRTRRSLPKPQPVSSFSIRSRLP